MPNYNHEENPSEFNTDDNQMELFQMKPEWAEHWKEMPEFNNKNMEAVYSISIHFTSIKDLKRFGDLIGQTVTTLTKGIYWPIREKNKWEYKDEEE